MTKRAVLYARVSGDDRGKDGRNLAGQLDMCREYAERQGWQVVAELAEDERGVSGARMDAPELNRALDMARAGQCDVLIVRELDRLARGLAKQLIIEEEFKRAAVQIEYVLGDYADTPEGNLLKNVRAVVAEYERLKIVERSARGRRQKALAGKWPCDGHAGYGYRKAGKAKDAILEVNEAEAAIVRRIFNLYIGVDGNPLPLQAIAALLTAEGVPPPNRGAAAARPGKGWHRGTLRTLIKNPRFIGEFQYGDIPLNLPSLAIIDRQTFEAAQRRRADSRARFVKTRKYDFLLIGHIKCSCGVNMAGSAMKQGRYLYYECGQRVNKRHLRTCTEHVLRADLADPIVWTWLHSILTSDTDLEHGLNRLNERRESDLQPHRERLGLVDDLIVRTDRKIKRLAAAYADEPDEVIAGAYQAELKSAAREREALISERAGIVATLTGGQLTKADRQAVLDLAANIRHKLQAPTFEQKRTLLNLLDVKVELTRQGEERCLKVTCGLKLTPNGKPEERLMPLSRVEQKSSSTMMTCQTPYRTVVFSTTIPLNQSVPADSLATDFFAGLVSIPAKPL